MNTLNLHAPVRALIITAIAIASFTAAAQDSSAPQLSYGVPQVLELSQAKVADDTIVRYIHNSGTIFALSAPEIAYLKQQGVSDTVLNAMLDQRLRLTGSTEPASAAPAPITPVVAQPSVIIEQPAIYVQPVPASMVYVIPDTQTYRYDRWHYAHENGFRYGNGFDDWPYSYQSVSITIGVRGGHADYFTHHHFAHLH